MAVARLVNIICFDLLCQVLSWAGCWNSKVETQGDGKREGQKFLLKQRGQSRFARLSTQLDAIKTTPAIDTDGKDPTNRE